MSHPITIARETYNTTLLDLRLDFELNHRLIKGIENPEIYFENVDRNLKTAAFDAAAESVANALKTLDEERVLSVLSAAGLKYKPTKWDVRPDGSRWVDWADVELAPLAGHRA